MNRVIKVAVLTLVLGSEVTLDESKHEHENHSTEAHEHVKEHKADAHGHEHLYQSLKNEVSKEEIEKAAKAKVQSLVAEKKIHKSWGLVPISKIGRTHYGDTDDWVVGFDNKRMKDKRKQTLYIFVNTRGEIRGANYTGN